jgi:hypothetical protein
LRIRVLLAALVLTACPDQVDQAAKKRIFSPEDPPLAVKAAREKLPPEEVASNPQIARRILGMGAAEATERLGAHKFTATVTSEWSAGGKSNKLTEERTLEAAKGGVSGDFHALLNNSRDQGLEVLRVNTEVFARSRYGKYRQRKRDRGMAERVREEIYGAIKDFDFFFRGRLKLSESGTVTFEGRTAWKYAVTLGEPLPDDGAKLPEPMVSKAGPDETTMRRANFYALRQPRALQGEVLVDAETSVVLKARLDGRLGVESDAGENAELHLILDSAMSGIGKDPQLKAPTEFLPDQDKPQGIAAALERFGIERVGKDAGTAAPAELPDDEP